MKILALDLGNYKSVGCIYELASLSHKFRTVVTTPKALHDLLVEEEPDRVVIEICPAPLGGLRRAPKTDSLVSTRLNEVKLTQ